MALTQFFHRKEIKKIGRNRNLLKRSFFSVFCSLLCFAFLFDLLKCCGKLLSNCRFPPNRPKLFNKRAPKQGIGFKSQPLKTFVSRLSPYSYLTDYPSAGELSFRCCLPLHLVLKLFCLVFDHTTYKVAQ